MFTNTKEVELHDLTYEYSSTLKKEKKRKQHTNSWSFSTSGWMHSI
jgi:hypothetical protein